MRIEAPNTGNVIENSSPERANELAIIDQIKTLPNIDEIRQEFVERRQQELGENPIRKLDKIDLNFSPIIGGFFDKSMKIQPGVNDKASFVIDDDQIYLNSIDRLQHINRNFPTMSSFQQALHAASKTTINYFGNFAPTAEEEQIRQAKFDAMDDSRARAYSISDEKSSALCAERAAVAHNILQFLGQESYYVGGELDEQSPDYENSELHAFVLVKNPSTDNYEIFDPTNPTFCYGDEELTDFQAFLPYMVDTGSNQLPQRGETFSAPYDVRFKDLTGQKQSKTIRQRTYTIGGK